MNSPAALTHDALLAHEEFVLRIARSLTQDESSALDLRQEAMVTALEGPPANTSVRGWFKAVLRSRARDQSRRTTSRSRREEVVARPEAQSSDPAASLEELELQQSVVSEVLTLKDLYRRVIIGIYHEGLSPTELAKRDGVKASSVRSQLSRAHEQLREKLDDSHGGRDLWASALLVRLSRQASQAVPDSGVEAVAGATAPPTLSAGLVPWIGAFAVTGCAIAAGALLLLPPAPPSNADGSAASSFALVGEPSSHTEGQAPASAGLAAVPAPAAQDGRQEVETVAPVEDKGAQLSGVGDVPDLLTKILQLKAEIIERALSVPQELETEFQWLGRDGGVVRLLDVDGFGTQFSLPWLPMGGSVYSFVERSHSDPSREQLTYGGGVLSPLGHGYAGTGLGPIALEDVPLTADPSGLRLGVKQAIEFDVAWEENGPTALRERSVEAALAAGQLSEKEAFYVKDGSSIVEPETRVGHSYLLRTWRESQLDALVAYEVLAKDEVGCTIAWRLLKEWPVEGDRLAADNVMQRKDLPPAPPAMSLLTDEDLRAELVKTEKDIAFRVFEVVPPGLESRFGRLRDEEGAGFGRLIPAGHPLCSSDVDMCTFDAEYANGAATLGYSDTYGQGQTTLRLRGSATGVVCDLGPIELDSVSMQSLGSLSAPKVKLALDERLGAPPSTRGPSDSDDYRKIKISLDKALKELNQGPNESVKTGHTYLVRSLSQRRGNVLLAAHVAAIDECGAFVAWRLLDRR